MHVEFWAKTTFDDQPGISVYEHMTNVGFVANCLAEFAPDLLARFGTKAAQAGALAALHDVGKISPGFQRKCAAWLEMTRLTDTARRAMWSRDMESDHGQVTHAAVQHFLIRAGAERRAAKYLSAVLGGHHGRLNRPADPCFRPRRLIAEGHSGEERGGVRNRFIGSSNTIDRSSIYPM